MVDTLVAGPRLRPEERRDPVEPPPAGVLPHLERAAAFAVPLAGLMTCAWILVIDHRSEQGDAASRLANAYYVFFGRDPHLAAIGFVWQPLQSMSEMPLFALKGVWPDLTRLAFDANIMSCLFMAGASYQLYRFLEDLSLRRPTRWLLLLGMIANPLVVYYGANGMSEALFIFCIVATTRYLARWLSSGGTRPLLTSAIWLGFAYGVRNEAAMAALFATLLVVAVSYSRAEGDVICRRNTAFADAVLFCAPFALVFVGWALTSYVIVGSFFEQFSSIYGNASQRVAQTVGQVKQSPSSALYQAVTTSLWFAPVLPVVLLAGALRTLRDRDLRFLAVAAVPGGVLVFEIVTYALGQLDDLERYFIYAIPLLIMALGCLARPLDKSRLEQRDERILAVEGREPRWLSARRRQRVLLSSVLGALAVMLAVPGLFTTDHEMFTSSIGRADANQVQYVRHPDFDGGKSSLALQYPGILATARMLDDLHVRHGGIMVDDFDACVPQVILASSDPDEFTIPNDQDWLEKFGVPYQFGIRYMVVADPDTSYGRLDALNREYPSLYANGQSMAVLARQFTIPACGTFRLYRLFPQES